MANKATEKQEEKQEEKQINVTSAMLHNAAMKAAAGKKELEEWIKESDENKAAAETYFEGTIRTVGAGLPWTSRMAWKVITHRILAPVAAVVVGVCMAGGATVVVKETKSAVNRRRAGK